MDPLKMPAFPSLADQISEAANKPIPSPAFRANELLEDLIELTKHQLAAQNQTNQLLQEIKEKLDV